MAKFSLPIFLRKTYGVPNVNQLSICGMDEVGRGAYAGPLVAAAVILPPRFKHPLLRDSKKLTVLARENVAAVIHKKALYLQIAEITVEEINLYGLGWANKEIFRRLAASVEADIYLCDGRLNIGGDKKIDCLVGGDDLVPAISAASIVAKVHRDALMTAFHEEAPIYGWASNKGYGAPAHRNAIIEFGTHSLHRRIFVDNLLQLKLGFETPTAPIRASS